MIIPPIDESVSSLFLPKIYEGKVNSTDLRTCTIIGILYEKFLLSTCLKFDYEIRYLLQTNIKRVDLLIFANTTKVSL